MNIFFSPCNMKWAGYGKPTKLQWRMSITVQQQRSLLCQVCISKYLLRPVLEKH